MIQRNLIIISAITILATAQATAKGTGIPATKYIEPAKSVGLIRNVYLSINDQVSDKCWTNTEEIKQKARLTLEQSGISVYTEPLLMITPFSTNLVITGLGLRTKSGICFGSIQVIAVRQVFTDFGNISVKYNGVNFYDESVALGRINLNSSFKSAVDTFISKFSANVISSRRDDNVSELLKRYKPSKPITVKKFIDMFKNNKTNTRKQ